MSALTPLQRREMDRKVMQAAMRHMRDRGGHTIKREDIRAAERELGHTIPPITSPRHA